MSKIFVKFNNSITLRYLKGMGKAKEISNAIKKLIIKALKNYLTNRSMNFLMFQKQE